MAIVDEGQSYRAGKTSYADIGSLYRASFERMANADPALGQVAWRVWSAVMVATVSRSKMLDRTSLNHLADAAGIRRKGGGNVSGRREEARAVAAALAELQAAGAITYVPAPEKAGRPATGSFVPVVVGLPDPEEIGVALTPIPAQEWGSGRPGNGGLEDRGIGVSETPLTEKELPRSEPRRRRGRRTDHDGSAWADQPTGRVAL